MINLIAIGIAISNTYESHYKARVGYVNNVEQGSLCRCYRLFILQLQQHIFSLQQVFSPLFRWINDLNCQILKPLLFDALSLLRHI